VRTSVIAVLSAIVAVGLLVFINRDRIWPPAPPPGVADTTAAPAVPAKKATKAQAILPGFDVVRVSREGSGVIAGRSAPNAEVTILADKKAIGTTVANKNGEWVLIFDDPLAPGTRQLSLTARVEGAPAVESDKVVIVVIPEPSGEAFTGGKDAGVVAVLSPRFGNGASRVLQKPGMISEDNGNQRLFAETIDSNQQGDIIITGQAGADMEVRVYIDNAFVGAAKSDSAGNWRIEPADPVAGGAHTLRLDAVLQGDDVEIRVEQPFERGMPLDATLAEGHVLVRPGNSLWAIARQIYGAGLQYTLIFGANQAQIRDPDLIYPGQKFRIPAGPRTEQPAPPPKP